MFVFSFLFSIGGLVAGVGGEGSDLGSLGLGLWVIFLLFFKILFFNSLIFFGF